MCWLTHTQTQRDKEHDNQIAARWSLEKYELNQQNYSFTIRFLYCSYVSFVFWQVFLLDEQFNVRNQFRPL